MIGRFQSFLRLLVFIRGKIIFREVISRQIMIVILVVVVIVKEKGVVEVVGVTFQIHRRWDSRGLPVIAWEFLT